MLVDKATVRDLIIVEILAIGVIAFAYFVWPYPPLVWKYDYSIVSTTNAFTIMMAVTAWMLVGYVFFLIAQSIVRFTIRILVRLGLVQRITKPGAGEEDTTI